MVYRVNKYDLEPHTVLDVDGNVYPIVKIEPH